VKGRAPRRGVLSFSGIFMNPPGKGGRGEASTMREGGGEGRGIFLQDFFSLEEGV